MSMYEKRDNNTPETGTQELDAIERFFGIIRRLRGPDGCPWDRKQTLSSMRRYVIEEGFEVVEGIDADDSAAIREELGDLFLITGMLSVIGEDSGRFHVAEVFEEISDKLVRRHPHVFGSSDADTPGAVEAQWEAIKRQEKASRRPGNGTSDASGGVEGTNGAPVVGSGSTGSGSGESGWDPGVSRSVPALERARRVQKSAAKEGFDWPEDWGVAPVFDKVAEELEELRTVSESGSSESRAPGGKDHAVVEEELGDLLFAVVNLSRKLKVDPSLALSRGTDKFARRFSAVMEEMESDRSIDELEAIWRRVKDRERH